MEELNKVNVVYAGIIPINRKLRNSEINNLINNGKLNWNMVNEERNPFLQAIVNTIINGKKINACISLYVSGKINITGITDDEYAKELYFNAVKDLKRNSKNCLISLNKPKQEVKNDTIQSNSIN